MKHIVVFGANGQVGRAVVHRLLEDGYDVTAFVHSVSRFAHHDRLKVIRGDIHDEKSVIRAMKGADAVLSALGSWRTPAKDILESGMTHIVPAMKKHRIKRIISLTGSEARASGDRLGALHQVAHMAATVLASKILHDGEKHISLLEQSGLEWTVIRSPIMKSDGPTGYRLSNDRPAPWRTINRYAVADAMVDQLTEVRFIGLAPFISR